MENIQIKCNLEKPEVARESFSAYPEKLGSFLKLIRKRKTYSCLLNKCYLANLPNIKLGAYLKIAT